MSEAAFNIIKESKKRSFKTKLASPKNKRAVEERATKLRIANTKLRGIIEKWDKSDRKKLLDDFTVAEISNNVSYDRALLERDTHLTKKRIKKPKEYIDRRIEVTIDESVGRDAGEMISSELNDKKVVFHYYPYKDDNKRLQTIIKVFVEGVELNKSKDLDKLPDWLPDLDNIVITEGGEAYFLKKQAEILSAKARVKALK